MREVVGMTARQSDRRRANDRMRANAPSSLDKGASVSLADRIARLAAEMRQSVALKRNMVNLIDLNIPPHREITEALRILVYELSGLPDESGPDKLWYRYGASTLESPIPVRSLSTPVPELIWTDSQTLNIGTLSFRHLDYDSVVDMYLIRDRETRTLTSSEIDHLAYSRMMEILCDPIFSDGGQIRMYQTGLEPLVIGVYRAVVDHLRERRKSGAESLVIQPVFHRKLRGNLGKLWG